ncbi:pyridoxamine 5'-phosphate oxidase family protein [Ktedonobacter racemifer]|uniref:Pyridoxamine 5'-phosphate oxidase-related FMN-binding protein n=1 Tax=Ktedonobacter racemifer DSM 44963 TaxID=485913 RepID=D6TUS7_KTERA|nr:pyridoxamine 5'-phosphate oxidase family protein [Ktedonobacter racemifer]EFH85253.1 pyridoxamine 5'-phosphate oxidase-related FMN-binding protein [Ktedonobacter racemifer DSM 44963]
MTDTKMEPKAERNLDGYGAPLIPWAKVRVLLGQSWTEASETDGPNQQSTRWLATVRPDGKPHVVPIGAIWIDEAFYFTAGADTRKARNLAHNPNCVLTFARRDFDLIFEGEAIRVTDPAKAQHIAEAYAAGGWPVSVVQGGASLTAAYSAPNAGPPPWDVYKVIPKTIYAMGTSEPYGATRWQF